MCGVWVCVCVCVCVFVQMTQNLLQHNNMTNSHPVLSDWTNHLTMFLRFQFISGHCCQNTKRKLSALQGNLSQTTQTGLDPNHYAVIKCVLWSFSLTNCEHDEHCLTPNVVCFLTFCQDSDLSILKHTVHVRNSPYSQCSLHTVSGYSWSNISSVQYEDTP